MSHAPTDMTRRAVITAVTVAVDCPQCCEPIAEPFSGSLNWEIAAIAGGTVIQCQCGANVAVILPKKLSR
jgi:hypothetical protein